MSQAVSDRPIEPDVRVPLVANLLQPVILLVVLVYWYFNADDPATYLWEAEHMQANPPPPPLRT